MLNNKLSVYGRRDNCHKIGYVSFVRAHFREEPWNSKEKNKTLIYVRVSF